MRGCKGVGVFSVAAWIGCATAVSQSQEIPALVQQMGGSWSVSERMWPGSGSAPIALPAATAERHLVAASLLQETMEAAPGSRQQFTRVASFEYNSVSKQYEYVSWDSRAPQMMVEKGRTALTLSGGRFVAPQWGSMKNVAFRYRLEVGRIQNGRQTVRLYFTPLSGDTREFRAFEYVYRKEP
jgi:hypothetical protein